MQGSNVEIKQLKDITKNMTLLYVEDNRCLSKINMQLFKDIFVEVHLAEDGESGLEMYQCNRYDLVISDINLPKMNGLVMLKEILELNEQQPVIVVSAYSRVEYLSKLQELKIEHFLTKPVNSKNMISAIYQSVKKLEVV
jgi:YesN/AraC family two-component response regulator